MCGIFGIIDSCNTLNAHDVAFMGKGEILAHRGPDDYGTYLDNTIFLLHRRLSIIDIVTGDQPIFNEDNSKCVIFNGEIYNYQELQKYLLQKGHIFTTKSDTEVIIHAYEEWGEECIKKFRGMFAFAIWDIFARTLFLARDRLGIKPLFYAHTNNKLYFASEMKAILAQPGFHKEIDPDALASFFSLSYIPAPLSIFKDIRKLPAGHSLTICDGKVTIKKYWDVYFNPDHSKNEKYFRNKFMEIFDEAVRLRMISDVPIGAFLSGGIDSGMVVGAMSKHCSEPVQTFSMGFGGNIGGYHDERKLAQLVSKHFCTKHREFEVQPQVKTIIENIVRSFDEPFADDSTIPSYYLSKITRENVTVSLSGLGGDELFGGYERYLGFKLSNFYNLLPKFIREKIIRQIIEKMPERSDGHYTVNHLKRFVRSASSPPDKRYFGFISTLNNEKNNIFTDPAIIKEPLINCEQMILNLFNSANAKNPLDKIYYCDMKTYLPEDILTCTDRISMWHSLEVRVPFIDHLFVEFCGTIPNEMKIKYATKKYLLRKEAANFLPQEILKQRKQGFASPMTQWINNDLRHYVRETLSEHNFKKHGLFNYTKIRSILDDHSNRKEINDQLIWSLLIFQTWYNLYM